MAMGWHANAGIGIIAGAGDHDQLIFLFLVAINAWCGLVAVISFGHRPKLGCVSEASPPPPSPCLSLWAETANFFGAFR